MSTITQPSETNTELLPHIESLRLGGDLISNNPTPSTIEAVQNPYRFLIHHLIPHAQAEDKALYPVVQKVMGASQATATMSRDHVEVGRLTEELGALQAVLNQSSITTEQAQDLRRILYGLYTLVKVHFAKEEEIYLPLLDANLSEADATKMFSTMEAAAHEAKEQLSAHNG
jgi:iron-sulfur cluster repair protein YtfE (RIC family)